ncbi:hypothetical protein KKA14_02185 [bacterium]|nr:hypothetical protein [bacterium]
MTSRKKDLLLGGGLLFGFAAILILMFSPLFNGLNSLNLMDNLYNSISKGSVYYIPRLLKENAAYQSTLIDVSINANHEKQAKEIAGQIMVAGAKASVEGTTVKISGSLGDILTSSLEDADEMFANKDEKARVKYGYSGKLALYNWWVALKSIDKELAKQKHFKDAKFVSVVQLKAVECAYNYYKIEPQDISDKIVFVILSLVFYVIYTIWFGFGILYTFMGLGFRLEH